MMYLCRACCCQSSARVNGHLRMRHWVFSSAPWQGCSVTAALTAAFVNAGCTDPSAANYNPSATSDDGSCTFVFEDAGKEMELSGTLHDYVTSALRSLWGAAPHLLTASACGCWQGSHRTGHHPHLHGHLLLVPLCSAPARR